MVGSQLRASVTNVEQLSIQVMDTAESNGLTAIPGTMFTMTR
jgi:hypothetical protein